MKIDFEEWVSKPVPPMPVLQVAQENRCGQETTDRVLQFLQEQRPDLIRHFLMYGGEAVTEYRGGFRPVVEFLRNVSPSEFNVPASRIEMLDLVFELHRRIQKFLGNPVPDIRGKPLAASPQWGVAPLISLPVSNLSPEVAKAKLPPGHFMDQETVDATLEAMYRRSPNIFYELAESLRRNVMADEALKDFFDLAKEIRPDLNWSRLRVHALRRLAVMCELDVSPH